MDQQIKKLYSVYYEQIYGETPYMAGSEAEQWINNIAINPKITADKIKESKLTDNITISLGYQLKVYQNDDQFNINDKQDFFVNDKQFTCATFSYRLVDKGLKFLHVYQARFSMMVARCLVFEYYLKKFDFVISDYTHSPLGRQYWKKLIQQALEQKMSVTVVDSKFNQIAEIRSIDQVDQYYERFGSSSCMFKISKVPL